VLGQTATLTPAAPGSGSGSDAAPALARTGGVALAGLALWLMVSGVLTKGAASRRLWNLLRRR
jgi:hypothetical protein